MNFYMLISILVIYMIVIAVITGKCTLVNKGKRDWKSIIKHIILLIVYLVVSFAAIAFLIIKYEEGVPDASSDLCISTGGWNEECSYDSNKAIIILVPVGVVIGLFHFLSIRSTHKLFVQDIKFFKYIILFLNIAVSCFYFILLTFTLYGLFSTTYYDSVFAENLRLAVIFSPLYLYAVSTFVYWYEHRKELKNT